MWPRLKPWFKGVAVLGVAALCLYLTLPIQNKIKLGLDLQGGVRVLLQLQTSPEVPKITNEVQQQVAFVLQNRVNGLGVSEPVISPVGADRIMVELPNVKNPDEAVQTLKTVAKLDFKIMPPAVYERAEKDKKYADDPNGAYKDSGPIVYAGADLKSAGSSVDQAGRPDIIFSTKKPSDFAKMTQANMGKLLATFLDKKYMQAATIQGVISDQGEITGNFTVDQTVTHRKRAQRRRAPRGGHGDRERYGRSDSREDRSREIDVRVNGRPRPRLDLHDRQSTGCRAFWPMSRS